MMNSWCLLLAAVFGLLFVVSSAIANCTEFYQPDGPQITPCKKEIILQNGQNYTIKCRANTPVEFIQQEPAEEKVGDFSSITQGNLTDENAEYEYEAYLELNYVDRYAIGFYACIRKESTIKKDVLNQLVAEPNNTAEISYIYIYVDGTDSLFAPMREVVMGKKGFYVAECKPTTPDVEVDILVDIPENTPNKGYSPKIGFIYDSETLDAIADRNGLTTIFTCGFMKQNETEDKDLFFFKRKCSIDNDGQEDQQPPIVIGAYKEFLPGETFSLNCSANYTINSAVHLRWLLPNPSLKVTEYSNNNAVTEGIVYRNITIENASSAYAGNYTCIANGHCGEKGRSIVKKFLDKPYLTTRTYDKLIKETQQPSSGFNVIVNSYPPASFTFYKNGIQIEKNETFEIITDRPTSTGVTLKIFWRNVSDSGNYTLIATNGHNTKNLTFDIKFREKPSVIFETSDKTCVQNMKTSLQCQVIGYPLPDVKWLFNDTVIKENKKPEQTKQTKFYEGKAILDIPCRTSGNIMCLASNKLGTANQTRRLVVYELPTGFGIYNQSDEKVVRFSEHQDATVKCVASLYYFSNVSWERYGEKVQNVKYTRNQLSLVARLKIDDISSNHSGKYVCRGERFDNTSTSDEIDIKVSPLQAPKVIFRADTDGNVQTFQPINMFCQAQGVPRPDIKWKKNNIDFKPENDSNIEFENLIVDYQTVNSSIFIKQMSEENRGEYECIANNSEDEVRTSATLTLKEVAYIKYVIAIAVIVAVLVILLIYLTCKVKKEKRFRKELAAAGLLYFKEGVTKSLNPELGIDEQAELLPYNEKFEFPIDKLVFGKQLGAGAFGVVYKADARGIINAEETTPVAVKMVKKTADNMYIKALASELKIMVHLGKHINIVNLLGACTKNVGKRELVVIVEYCKFGNIHNYMQRHREVFIDQFSDTNKEKSFGKVNRGYDSSGSTGVQSDYGTANTQDTEHTCLSNNTNRTSRKTSEGYVQPEWRCNYVSDYSYDGRSPRPLTSRDLLAWAFQIARGMEYLVSRKVLHGDLAARNILLAEDNIVKICDFGLARSIYKNDEYQKKENSLLPVKWLAIECMTDRIFSTQSDVWSFGIVLWELFTLAKTPYPNMSPAHLLQFLREGHRLEKPAYSDDRIYKLMKRCWEDKPTTRPSFTQLQEILGTFLEDNVRNHYVDLNSAFMDGNSQPEGQEDYLAMVSAPDYNNMVTPSPHHYVNEVGDPRRFFPPSPNKVDEEGYLQMSPANIFSPKSTATKFDFDSRKFNSRPSEASSGGSELTPMLTLNNLARSGSDSDHEGNVSPLPNVCPRIEEEPDDVFDNKQSKKTLDQNAKNAQITNATNPMYITFGLDAEKKPIDNNYVNIIPNGLVK